MITVILGIILGLIITPPLHDVVMTLLEVDHIVFLRKINIQSYIYSSILTLSFSLIPTSKISRNIWQAETQHLRQ